MEIESVPPALQARLGPEATGGLLQLLHRSDLERRGDVIAACTERFERRLVEETSALRVQLSQVESSLGQDIASMGSVLRSEIASGRVDLFKWCFLFWVGQVLAIGGLLAVMLRLTR